VISFPFLFLASCPALTAKMLSFPPFRAFPRKGGVRSSLYRIPFFFFLRVRRRLPFSATTAHNLSQLASLENSNPFPLSFFPRRRCRPLPFSFLPTLRVHGPPHRSFLSPESHLASVFFSALPDKVIEFPFPPSTSTVKRPS